MIAGYSILNLVLALAVLALIWKVFLSFFVEYLIAGYSLGFKHIGMIYKPLSTYNTLYKQSILKYKHCFGFVHEKVKKNPDIKIIFLRVFGITHLSIIDAEMVKQISFSHVNNLRKRQLLVFFEQLEKGLLFSEGDTWKRSRKIMSNIFHFEAISSRQAMMKEVINSKISKLDDSTPHLLRLGCSISGQVVIKSLFGQRFYAIRFDGRTPYQEINELMANLVITSRKLPNLIRSLFGQKARKDSLFLTKQQKVCLGRLMEFKRICREFLQQQKDRFKNGEPVTGFLEVYFKQQDNDLEEMIQQLYVFLIAGEDTTGGLISWCLLHLGLYPKYQEIIHNDIVKNGVHASKQLINRLATPVQNSLSRIVTEPFSIDGYTFKQNTALTFGYFTVMRSVKLWEQPNEFNPDRFNEPLENPSAYTPFSNGPRNCIGQHMALMQVRLTLAGILSQYHLSKVGGQVIVSNTGVITIAQNQHSIHFKAKAAKKE